MRTRWSSLTLCVVAFVGDVTGLLTKKAQAPCANSDGVHGYNFSHRGLWIPGYTLVGTGFTKQTCSDKCSKTKGCVAFSGAFKEEGGNGGCYTYAATGGNVPSSTDRAYKKCFVGDAMPAAHAADATNSTHPRDIIGVHFMAKKVMTVPDLLKQAETMEAQLDEVTKTMNIADTRMRKLKTMVALTATKLTDAGRIASRTSEIALGNRGGLLAIARAREEINMSFNILSQSEVQGEYLLKKIKGRVPGKGSKAKKGPSLAGLAPNVTALEKEINKLNDPATLAEISATENTYNNFTGGIRSTVKLVLRDHLRGLVDTQREALYNYTTALQDNKKDPCCVPGCKQ
jgi:hypothetical protein